MARARPGLEKAVLDALERHGMAGRRLSFRQAERLTGLSPATVGELAKGNARTPETIRRFAQGLGEDVNRFLLLAGFVPEDAPDDDIASPAPLPRVPALVSAPRFAAHEATQTTDMEPDEREWLGRFGRALAKMPPGRERDLFKDSLRRDTELLESFLERLAVEDRRPRRNGAGSEKP